jgi:hypothetical protein
MLLFQVVMLTGNSGGGPSGNINIKTYANSTSLASGNITISTGNFSATGGVGSVNIETNNINRLKVAPDGNMGILQPNPTQALDINGNLKISGAFMPGGLAGAPGEVLVSQGTNAAPIWDAIFRVKKFILTTNLFAGPNTIVHNFGLVLAFEVMVEVRDTTTGSSIATKVTSYTTNSFVIDSPSNISSVTIIVIG